MRNLFVYNSQSGNTQSVTQIIAVTLQIAEMMHVDQAAAQQLSGLELLIVGSRTQRHNMIPAMAGFLDAIPDERWRGPGDGF